MNIEDRITDVICNDDWRISEPNGEFMVELQMCKILKKKVFLYGASVHAYSLVRLLKNEGIDCIAVLDTNKQLKGKDIYGIPIIDATNADDFNDFESDNLFAFVTTFYFRGNTMKDIVKLLIKRNIVEFYVLTDVDKQTLLSEYRQYWWIDELRDSYYKNNIPIIIEFAKKLSDDKSRDVLCNYLESYCTNSVYKGEEIKTSYKYFFDSYKEKIYEFDKNEVWINCGASVGDTIYCAFANGLNFKKIVAIECEYRIARLLEANIARLPIEYRDNIVVVEKFLDEKYCIEDILEKITLVNMDIEGNEIAVLKTLKNRLILDRPVLAIAMYHRKEDIERLTEYFKDFKDYSFYLRKYASWQDIHNHNHEVVLYAIPKEREI